MRALSLLVALALVAGMVALLATSGDRSRRAAVPDASAAVSRPAPASALDEPALSERRASPAAVQPNTKEVARAIASFFAKKAPDSDLAAFRVEARVVTSEGAPLEGVALRVLPFASGIEPDGELPAPIARSGPDGSLVADVVFGPNAFGANTGVVSPGTVRAAFAFEKDEWSGAVEMLDVVTGETARLGTVALEPAGTIRGVVLGPSGEPVVGALVGWSTDGEERARSFRDEAWCAPALSDLDGRFALRQARFGAGQLHARALGLVAESESLELVRGIPLEVVLRLEPDGAARLALAGRVLRPDGTPEAGALVFVSHGRSVAWRTGIGRTRADDGGRFEVTVELEEPLDERPVFVVATDDERWSRSPEVSVSAPPTEPLVLTLVAPRVVRVTVADPEGAPIPWSNVRLNTELGGGTGLLPLGATGSALVPLPESSFRVEAFGLGFRTETFGPFEPDEVGDDLQLELLPGAAVHGRVVFEGRGVAGARLSIGSTYAPGDTRPSRDVAPRETPFDVTGLTVLGRHDRESDAEGRFLLTLNRDGWQNVRVEAKGFPPTVFGPFRWSRDAVYQDVELALERGGAIEGRVLVAAGAEVGDRVVGASNGWSFARTATTDADGRYRIEGLAPGRYQVRSCSPPVASLQGITPQLDFDGGLQARASVWDCVVESEGTTRFDLDLRSEGAFVLVGQTPMGCCDDPHDAALCEIDDPDRIVAQTEVDAEGKLELSLSRGGPFTLATTCPVHGGFEQEIDLLPGTNEWLPRVELGILTVRFREERAGWLLVEWSDGRGLSFRGSVANLGLFGSTETTVRIPAGTCRLLARGRRGSPDTLWREIDIQAGGETTVDYP